MAEVGKKKISVSRTISPFEETKTKKVPDWVDARPAALRGVAPLTFQRTLELDPRKWKKKTIEDGIYAIARYDLQLFATLCGQYEKSVLKARPKDRAKAKFVAKDKSETAEEKAALDTAEAKMLRDWKKLSKAIQDKVSLALDEIESDKGDNTAALKMEKNALKKFDALDTTKMFSGPTIEVVKAIYALGVDLEVSGEKENTAALKVAIDALVAAEKDFERTAKTTRNVANYLLSMGAKMAKDTKADPALQHVGKMIAGSGNLKTSVTRLTGNVDAFDKSLDDLIKVVKSGKASGAQLKSLAKAFGEQHKSKDKAVTEAIKAVKIVAKKFDEAMKSVK